MTESENEGIISRFVKMFHRSKYSGQWMFRDSKPKFKEDDILKIYTPELPDRNETVSARIGDTTIEIKDAPENIGGSLVEIRISHFNDEESHGEAELISFQE
ncbi:DUF7513 family protein [Halococcus thailandensis]|uniref:DUF7513 family protein n=1 Tax=Halococcus thailandensis TaxID=335952 RepID=UPI001267A889|nr:hypothetical protein [Halococcus thailandensis]